MRRNSLRNAAIAGLLASPFVIAGPANADNVNEMPIGEAVFGNQTASAEVGSLARPAERTSFNFRNFFVRAVRMRLANQRINYTLTVAPDGAPTQCTFSPDFRNLATSREVCREIIQNIALKPALDDRGMPIESTYSSAIDIYSYFTPQP